MAGVSKDVPRALLPPCLDGVATDLKRTIIRAPK
jgi:hypothetical protein